MKDAEKTNLFLEKESKAKLAILAEGARQSLTGYVETLIDNKWKERLSSSDDLKSHSLKLVGKVKSRESEKIAQVKKPSSGK